MLLFVLQMPDNVSLERDSQGRMTCEVCGYKTTVSALSGVSYIDCGRSSCGMKGATGISSNIYLLCPVCF